MKNKKAFTSCIGLITLMIFLLVPFMGKTQVVSSEPELFKEVAIPYYKDGLWGWANKYTGKLLIPASYDSTFSWAGQRFMNQVGDKVGMIDGNSKIGALIEIPAVYENVFPVQQGYVVKNSGFYGVLNFNLDQVIPNTFISIRPVYTSNHQFLRLENSQGYFGLYDLGQQRVIVDVAYDLFFPLKIQLPMEVINDMEYQGVFVDEGKNKFYLNHDLNLVTIDLEITENVPQEILESVDANNRERDRFFFQKNNIPFLSGCTSMDLKETLKHNGYKYTRTGKCQGNLVEIKEQKTGKLGICISTNEQFILAPVYNGFLAFSGSALKEYFVAATDSGYFLYKNQFRVIDDVFTSVNSIEGGVFLLRKDKNYGFVIPAADKITSKIIEPKYISVEREKLYESGDLKVYRVIEENGPAYYITSEGLILADI